MNEVLAFWVVAGAFMLVLGAFVAVCAFSMRPASIPLSIVGGSLIGTGLGWWLVIAFVYIAELVSG